MDSDRLFPVSDDFSSIVSFSSEFFCSAFAQSPGNTMIISKWQRPPSKRKTEVLRSTWNGTFLKIFKKIKQSIFYWSTNQLIDVESVLGQHWIASNRVGNLILKILHLFWVWVDLNNRATYETDDLCRRNSYYTCDQSTQSYSSGARRGGYYCLENFHL